MDRSLQCLVVVYGDDFTVKIVAFPPQDILSEDAWLSNEAVLGQELDEIGDIENYPTQRGLFVAEEDYVSWDEGDDVEAHYTLTPATLDDLLFYGFNLPVWSPAGNPSKPQKDVMTTVAIEPADVQKRRVGDE